MPEPFYDRDEHRREFRALVVRLCDAFGAPRICPRPACMRRHGCADDDPRDLPFCFWHYRGAIRMVVAAALAHHGLKPGTRADEPDREPQPVRPWRGPSLLDRLEAGGAPVERLRRPGDAGEDAWTWERDERARALVASFSRPSRRSRGNR